MCAIHKLLRPAHKVVAFAACKSSADWRFLDHRGGGYIPASKHGACTEERHTVAQLNDVAFGDGFAEEARKFIDHQFGCRLNGCGRGHRVKLLHRFASIETTAESSDSADGHRSCSSQIVAVKNKWARGAPSDF